MVSNSQDANPARQPAGRSANYARLRELFDACVDLPEGDRLAFIERNVTDEAMRVELALMLAQDESPANPFATAPLQKLGDLMDDGIAALPDLIGSHCGPFRLMRLIGSGGQGAVYLGERDDGEFVQQAAVKLLREAILDAADLRRFRRERDILGRFAHAGVARLIDAGLGELGLPYLAMEYVDGQTLDCWCTQRNANRALRLELFAQLCEVIAAAHRQLIVHRDIKPSNVLVDHEGNVKVLDFGIARLIDDDAANRTDALMLTPGYGAPEQRRGDMPTPASDVFALGVLLRELIAAQSPPCKPGDTWPPWPDDVPNELRWVFDRCCVEEAVERYRDAAELLEDIENYRALRPLRAHPPSNWYRARKFVARHRGGVTLTALLLLTTLVGFGLSLWQTHVANQESARATAEARRARATSEFLIGLFRTAQDGLAEDEKPTVDVLVQVAAKKLEQDTKLPPATRAEFIVTLANVARHGSDPDSALALFERAFALRADQPPTRQSLRDEALRAQTLSRLGRGAEAVKVLAPRMAAIRAEADATAVVGLWTYADALGEIGRMDEYVQGLKEAYNLAVQVHGVDAEETLALQSSYAIALYATGDSRQAADNYTDMLQRWRAAGLPKQRDYAISLANLGAIDFDLGELDAAETLLREAVELEHGLHKPGHPNIAILSRVLGQVLVGRGKFSEAEPILQEAYAQLDAVFGPAHHETLETNKSLAELDLEQHHVDAAVARLQSMRETCAAITDGTAGTQCKQTKELLERAKTESRTGSAKPKPA